MPSAYTHPTTRMAVSTAFVIVFLWTTQTIGVHAAACNATVLASIARDANLLGCISTSGVSLASIAATPDAQQLEGLCHSDACIAFVSDLKALELQACTAFDGQIIDLATNFVEPVLSACTAMGVVTTSADGSAAAGMKSSSNLRGSSTASASEDKDAAIVDGNDPPNAGISVAVSEEPTPTPTSATPKSAATLSHCGFTVQLAAALILLGFLV